MGYHSYHNLILTLQKKPHLEALSHLRRTTIEHEALLLLNRSFLISPC